MGEILKFPDRPKGDRPDVSTTDNPDNVIHVDFETPRPKKESASTDNEDLLQATINIIPRIRIFLGSLRGNISSESISLRNDLVGRYSDTETMEAIVKSTANDWMTHPSFYIALLNRFDKSVVYAQRLSGVKDYTNREMGIMDELSNGSRSSDEQDGPSNKL